MSIRIFQNNTATDLVIKDVGQIIPASGTLEMEEGDFLKWAGSEDIDPIINGVSATLFHEGVALDPFDALCLIHEITDYIDIYEDETLTDRKTKELNFTGCRFNTEYVGEGRVDVAIKPFVITRKACIGFTRKGGFIMSRK